jgi:hypothetical protein
MNSLGWSRRDTDAPVNTAQQTGLFSSIKSLNPFGDSGYVRLPTTEGAGAPLPARNRREEEDAWFVCESTFPPPPLCSTAPASANFADHVRHAAPVAGSPSYYSSKAPKG